MNFPRYAEYKDSGVEWLGEVPEHWGVVQFRRIFRLLTEKTDRRIFPVALENIVSWSGQYIATETKFEGEGVAFDVGDILFGKLRPYLAKALLADQAGEAVGDFHVLRSTADMDGRFALHQILNREFISIVDGSTFGSKMPRVGWDFMGGLPLAIPPCREQSTIAAFLDRETTKIDALVAEQEKLIALLKEKRQAVISHAVTKGLNPDAPMKDSGVEWLGEVPEHWGVVPFYNVISERNESNNGMIENNLLSLSFGRIIKKDITSNDGLLPESFETYQIIRPGDIVLRLTDLQNDKRSLRSAIVEQTGIITSAYLAVIPFSINHLYAAFLLRSYDLMKVFYSMGGGLRQSMKFSDIKRLPTLQPPKKEQSSIAAYLDRETAKLDTLTTEAQRAIDLLKERRSALISAAVTGKIDVRGLVVV
ncbi:MAG: hypothetical protein H7832_01255 [Magnetococcus sp. DMHC-6]